MNFRVRLLQNFNLEWFVKTSDVKKAKEIVEGIQFLDKHEFMALFPEAAFYEDKFPGMTKSFVVYGGWK